MEKESRGPEPATSRESRSRCGSSNAAPKYLVPSLVHFIFLGEETPFRFLHYLAILSVHLRSRPDQIVVHGSREPVESPWWRRIRPLVTYEEVELVRKFRGRTLDYYQHQADVIRLEKLIERGGIYMDLDVLTLRSLDPLRRYSCVLGGERYRDGSGVSFSNDPHDFASVANGVIMAVPESPFLKEWYQRMEIGDVWAHHSVVTPHELILERPELVHVEPVESFFPFSYRDEFVFADLPSAERAALLEARTGQSHTAHFWETMWGPRYLYGIDPDYLETRHNLFVDLVGDLPVKTAACG